MVRDPKTDLNILPTEGEMERLLDELPGKGALPLLNGFAQRVHVGRPFAPWEARFGRHWKTPAAVFGLLAGSSTILGLLPLLRLGPETALSVWGHLLGVALIRPVALGALGVEAIPGAARGLQIALGTTTGGFIWIGIGLLLTLTPVVLSLHPAFRRRQTVDASRK